MIQNVGTQTSSLQYEQINSLGRVNLACILMRDVAEFCTNAYNNGCQCLAKYRLPGRTLLKKRATERSSACSPSLSVGGNGGNAARRTGHRQHHLGHEIK